MTFFFPGIGAEEVLQDAEMDQRKLAAKTVEKARAICAAHSVLFHIQLSLILFKFSLIAINNDKNVFQ